LISRQATRRHALALLAGAGASLFGRPAHAQSGWSPVAVRAGAIPFDETDTTRRQVGRLLWRGGLHLGADDKRFGGWSDIWVAPGNDRATLISDRGGAMELGLDFGATLDGVGRSRIGPLIGPDGRPLDGYRNADAEGMTRLPDGGFAVSLERRHRILIYPPSDPPFSSAPRTVAAPPGFDDVPANGGMEALARLPDGRFLVLVEERPWGFVGGESGWTRFEYRAAPSFKPVGVCVVGDAAIVLERSFTWAGLASRIVRVKIADLREGAAIDGEELARLRPPITLDNFEGIATTKDASGRDLLWLIADDNFSILQRTLLVCFEIS
jgi:hypothetical protein